MRLHALAPVLLGALLSTTAACETRISLGAPCTSAAQCNDGLLCSFGRCRAGCERQADCGGTQVCIQASGERAVCTLADDTCGGGGRCSAGLVCNGSVCAAPCTTTSCVSGSSCRTDSVSMREVCVRDAVMSADAGSDALASDAAVAQDAWVDQCALGSVAAASSVTLAQLLGGTATQPIEPIANLEITPDGSGPIAIPFNEPFALALEGQRAWIASSTSTGTGRSADRLLWDVDNIFGAGLVVTDIATDFVAINDVSAADTRLGQDGLSALFVRLNPDVRMPALFYRLTDNGPGIAPLSISISDTTDAIFPSDAVLFGGFQASGDDSAIALTIQGIDGVNTATQLFLIPGTAPTDSGRTLELGGVWPTPLPLVGTQGALAALNRTTGRVQVLRLDENGTFPTRWTWGEDMRASHMAFTNVPARENEFLIASMNGCSHVLITRIECASSSGCTELGRIRVLARSYTNELHITPVGSGFALVTREDNIEITWLDASLRIVAPPSAFPTPLFTFNPAAFPTFNFERISIAANSDGFMAVALFRDGKTARYFRRGVRLAP